MSIIPEDHQVTYLVRLGTDGQWKWQVNPSAKFTADWYIQFPPATTPRFLVDLGPDYERLNPRDMNWCWKVINVQSLYLDDMDAAQILLDQGWGALSYQWGAFLPTSPRPHRPVYADRKFENLPQPYIPPNATAEMARGYNWGIPKLAELPLETIKGALLSIGKRFVWWDGACLPQKDQSGGYAPDPNRAPEPFPGPPDLPGNLGQIASEEVSKQKYVYSRARVGAIWLNRLDWTTRTADITRLLNLTPAIAGLDVVRTMLTRELDEDGVPGLVPEDREGQSLLATVMRDLTGAQNIPTTVAEWRNGLKIFTDSIMGLRKDEGWFTSLWSFQEGRLLKKQAFVDSTGHVVKLGLPFDEKTKRLPFPQTRVKIRGETYRIVNYPGVQELTALVTLVATQISTAYTCAWGTQDKNKFVNADLVAMWKDMTGGTNSGKTFLENVMLNLTASGLLFTDEDAPLELLVAARRTRFPSFYYSDEYYAMTGVLDLIKYDDGDRDFSIQNPYGADGPRTNDEDTLIKYLYEDLPKWFFQALVKRYQWLVLMFAKRPLDHRDHWGAVSMGHFETINPYCIQLMVKNELKIERRDWRYVLPRLTYLPKVDELQLTPPAGSLRGVVLEGSTVMKISAALYITTYAVTAIWGEGQLMLWTLGDNANMYEDDVFLPGGRSLPVAGRARKPSNIVTSKSLKPEDLRFTEKDPKTNLQKPSDRNANPWLLIPFESLGFDLAPGQSTSASGTRAPNGVFNLSSQNLTSRCMLVTDLYLAGEGQDVHYKGVFRGNVDVFNLVVRPVLHADIRLKWQGKPPAGSSSNPVAVSQPVGSTPAAATLPTATSSTLSPDSLTVSTDTDGPGSTDEPAHAMKLQQDLTVVAESTQKTPAKSAQNTPQKPSLTADQVVAPGQLGPIPPSLASYNPPARMTGPPVYPNISI